MIEKLDLRENVEIIPIKGSCHDYCLAKSSVLIKINELVDAVNNLQTSNAHIQKDLCEMRHPEAKVDPYAEQRKWIGKLCKFWDDDPNNYIFDKLKEITFAGCYIKESGFMYEHCEPVKPDDDIIYKGGKDE